MTSEKPSQEVIDAMKEWLDISALEERISVLEDAASLPASSDVPEARLAALEKLVAKNINRAV